MSAHYSRIAGDIYENDETGEQFNGSLGALLPEMERMRATIIRIDKRNSAKDALLLEMFQALAGVLGDMEEHRRAVREIVHSACEVAVSHWLEMTHPEPKP